MILTILAVTSDGKKVSVQRHFNQQTLEAFNKALDRGASLDLPPGLKMIDVEGIEDRAPFKCGTKQVK